MIFIETYKQWQGVDIVFGNTLAMCITWAAWVQLAFSRCALFLGLTFGDLDLRAFDPRGIDKIQIDTAQTQTHRHDFVPRMNRIK